MCRTARRSSAFFLSAVALATLSVAASADEPPSPARVLQQVDAQLGASWVNIPALPAKGEGDDKTLAPFLYVLGGDPEKERLPLKGVSADVQVAGVIARVRVQQTFENTGKQPIEAVYVFPASTRAAVHAMRMKIGQRTVEAKIDRKATAREKYEAARAAGQRASLLEQQRPNVFTMNVANLMPGDRIDVQLDYSELLVPEDSIYEFVFPTVVGPRYGGGADPEKDKWIANPYLPQGSPEPFPFSIRAHLETAIPIKELASPSHKVAVKYANAAAADVTLDQPGGGNKDFVLRYRLAGDRVETGVLLYPGDQENFFLMMMEPPQRPTVSQIPPREYVFVLDVSGSMHGFPLDTAKALMRDLLSSLRPTDYFNVVLFSGAYYVMNPRESLAATKTNIQAAIDVVERQNGGGGTELMGALQGAYGIPKFKQGPGISRSVVVVTDGYVGVEAQAFKFIREHLNEANLFAFGIGSSVNRALIEGMARAGQGEPFVVLKPETAAAQAGRFRRYIDSPVLANINVRFEDFGAYDVAPQKLPDLMARRPVVLFGKYRGGPTGRVHLNGVTGGGAFHDSIEIGPHTARAENAPLRSLWARKWIEILDDERAMAPGAKELEEAITQLGLQYTLLTSFTSFVAVDSEVVNRGGQGDRVAQPLPLPEGVSNHAVGAPPPPASPSPSYGMGGLGVRGHASGGSGYGGGYGRAMPTLKPAPPAKAAYAAERPVAQAAGAIATGELGTRGRTRADDEVASITTTPSAGKAAKKEPKADEKAKAKEQQDVHKALQIVTSVQQNVHVADPAALLRAVEGALKGGIEGAGPGALRLRVTVDGSGLVTRVEFPAGGEPKLQALLRKALAGLRTAAKASGAPAGTLEILVQLR